MFLTTPGAPTYGRNIAIEPTGKTSEKETRAVSISVGGGVVGWWGVIAARRLIDWWAWPIRRYSRGARVELPERNERFEKNSSASFL